MTVENTTLNIEQTVGPQDFAVCAAMMAATSPWLTMGLDVDYCRKAFDGQFREVFLLKKREEIVGFVIMQPQGSFKGYIQTLCVREGNRGQGYGKMLLQFCEDRILQYSPNIFICVSTFNQKALQLYLSFGFEPVGEIKNFVKDGFDELLLRKTAGAVVGYTPAEDKK